MRCEDFEVRLNEVLDERRTISSADDLTDHVRDCGNCRSLARSYEAVFAGLRQAAIPAEPEWVTRRVLAQLEPATVRLPWRRAATVLALAATLLLAVGLGWVIKPSRPVATNSPKSLGGAFHDQPHLAQTPTVGNARSRRAGTQGVAPAPTALSSGPNANELMGLIPAADWAQDVADGLEPVTQPTVGAITGFLRLWGVGDEGRRS
ncbi:MAG TPA: hypothetical protein VNH11_34395 [Pirellulales bacterium]|nr:hypothetical protein [Pirellulales bacterium]